MATFILDHSIIKDIEYCTHVAEVRDTQGNLVGQFVPNQEHVKRVYERAKSEIPPLTAEERAEAIAEWQRGECLTSEQASEWLRDKRRLWDKN